MRAMIRPAVSGSRMAATSAARSTDSFSSSTAPSAGVISSMRLAMCCGGSVLV
jgi:hypothetical protein